MATAADGHDNDGGHGDSSFGGHRSSTGPGLGWNGTTVAHPVLGHAWTSLEASCAVPRDSMTRPPCRAGPAQLDAARSPSCLCRDGTTQLPDANPWFSVVMRIISHFFHRPRSEHCFSFTQQLSSLPFCRNTIISHHSPATSTHTPLR